MNTNYSNVQEIQKLYSDKFISEKNNPNETKHLAQMLMFRFLSKIEKITDERKISRKELAKQIGVSPSYLTQLYRGVKPLNMETLAKIELALDFRFDIKAVDKSLLEETENTADLGERQTPAQRSKTHFSHVYPGKRKHKTLL